ncbi:MAG: endonuclease/exonuclease/phosphatase family protein [Treponema sp.]
MKIRKNKTAVFALAITAFFNLCACSFNSGKKNQSQLTFTNWNVQTFFDGITDGTEYAEFKNKKSGWSIEQYEKRLDRLCSKIEQFDSDFFIMEELENEKIIYDISNRLSRNVWFKNKIYQYAAFQKNEKSSIGCGILSKYEITDVKVHNLDIKTEKDRMPDMRPVMEVTAKVCGKNKSERKITIFINHWKSKSGGQSQTEKWRLWQETVLSRLLNSRNKENDGRIIIAAGDFNKDINDFSYDKNQSLYFSEINSSENKKIPVFSPYNQKNQADAQDEGTYFFRGKWEKIDHFFAVENIFTDFRIEKDDDLLTDEKIPARYEIFTGKGYSDHLPVSCTVNAE